MLEYWRWDSAGTMQLGSAGIACCAVIACAAWTFMFFLVVFASKVIAILDCPSFVHDHSS